MGMRICRVCGKSYEACRTPRTNGVFYWQEVSCSPECGAIYLAELNRSRGIFPDAEDELYYIDVKDEAWENDATEESEDEEVLIIT